MTGKKLGERLERSSSRPTDPEGLTTKPAPPKTVESEREPGLRVWEASYAKEGAPKERPNQDVMFYDLDDQGMSGTFLVADGVGGGPAAEVASGIVRKRVQDENGQLRGLQRLRRASGEDVVVGNDGDVIRETEVLRHILQSADRDMKTEAVLDTRKTGMSSTATLARITQRPSDGIRELSFAHCGDSRLSVVDPDGYLRDLTLDANVALLFIKGHYGRPFAMRAQAFLDSLESLEQYARLSARWDPIEAQGIDRVEFEHMKSYLGEKMVAAFFSLIKRTEFSLGRLATIDTGSISLPQGSTVLLTTDGIHKNLRREEISAIIKGDLSSILDEEVAHAARRASRPADALIWASQIRAANIGGRDDMTAIVVAT